MKTFYFEVWILARGCQVQQLSDEPRVPGIWFHWTVYGEANGHAARLQVFAHSRPSPSQQVQISYFIAKGIAFEIGREITHAS